MPRTRASSDIGSPISFFGWTWALFYHLCNGIRHLFGMRVAVLKLDTAAKSGYLVGFFIHRVNRFRLGRRLQHDGSDDEYAIATGRVRGLGSAKNGTHHWWMQRVTAVALIPLVIWFAIAMIGLTGASYDTSIAWMQSPFNAIMMVLLIIATFHHVQLGLQVCVEDYVHSEGVKVVLMMGQKLITFALAITAGFAVLKIAFGG